MIIVTSLIRIINVASRQNLVTDSAERTMMAAIVLLLWLKVLPFLSVFQSTGPLIRTMSKMMSDFIQFLAVYVLFWIGWAIAFYVLLGRQTGDNALPQYADIWMSLLTVFRAVTGDFGFLDGVIDNYQIVYILFVLYVLLAGIMLLNLLIAMMNTSFNLVLYVSEKEWLMIRASFILRIQRGLGRREALHLMRSYLVTMNRAMTTIQNYTPGARTFKTERYCVWESSRGEQKFEVNIQYLRQELLQVLEATQETIKKENNEVRQLFLTQMERIARQGMTPLMAQMSAND